MTSLCFHKINRKQHRVDRVPGFLSGSPNRLPLPPHPQAGVPPPLWFQRGEAHSLSGEGAGGANADEGTDTLAL
jgi:hypothetical protein